MLVYTKGSHAITPQYLPYSEEYKKRFIYEDERGKYFWDNIGTYSQERLKRLEAEGRIKYPNNPNAKEPLDNEPSKRIQACDLLGMSNFLEV